MSRTTEALSFVDADVEVSQDNVVWVDLAPYSSAINVSGGDRNSGEINVFADERPIVRSGKKGSQDVTIRYAYTEETGGPFDELRGWDDQPGGTIYVRYWPAGKAAGNYVFKTVPQGYIITFQDPQGEAASGDPVLCEIQVKTEELQRSVWVS